MLLTRSLAFFLIITFYLLSATELSAHGGGIAGGGDQKPKPRICTKAFQWISKKSSPIAHKNLPSRIAHALRNNFPNQRKRSLLDAKESFQDWHSLDARTPEHKAVDMGLHKFSIDPKWFPDLLKELMVDYNALREKRIAGGIKVAESHEAVKDWFEITAHILSLLKTQREIAELSGKDVSREFLSAYATWGQPEDIPALEELLRGLVILKTDLETYQFDPELLEQAYFRGQVKINPNQKPWVEEANASNLQFKQGFFNAWVEDFSLDIMKVTRIIVEKHIEFEFTEIADGTQLRTKVLFVSDELRKEIKESEDLRGLIRHWYDIKEYLHPASSFALFGTRPHTGTSGKKNVKLIEKIRDSTVVEDLLETEEENTSIKNEDTDSLKGKGLDIS